MRLRGPVAITVALGLSGPLGNAYAQCTKDTDCKGDRVCRGGTCEDPLPAAAASPASASLPRRLPSRAREQAAPTWFSGYGSIAALVSAHAWIGGATEHAGGGFHAAGYWVPIPLFHIGAFFHFYEANSYAEGLPDGHRAVHCGGGLSPKIGVRPTDRTWIGAAFDVGVHIANGELNKVGVHLFPRLEVERELTSTGTFKLGLFASVGPMFGPLMGGYVRGADDDSLVALQALLGLMVGG